MIEILNLTKVYGDKTAVDDISFDVRPGFVTGFLGPNGAGKSTTMRMVLGLDRPTSGRALVNGRPYVDAVAPTRGSQAAAACLYLRWSTAAARERERRWWGNLDRRARAIPAGRRRGSIDADRVDESLALPDELL